MDKEVLHLHCIFSFAMSCFPTKLIRRDPNGTKIGADFLVSQVLKSPEFLS